jgi:hypothetical protein
MWRDGRVRGAHRVFWEDANGPIPEGCEIDHLCRNRGCVNPDHMEPVLHAENCRRSSVAKLNAIAASEIRRLDGFLSQQRIAELFAVDQTTISRVQRGESW